MSNFEHFAGLWRASAMEKVPYTEDFPESLLVLPEFYDGAIAHGKATHIQTTVTWQSADDLVLDIEDNGGGIKNLPRLLSWAAPSSIDNYHRNGHGHKKAMTKFAPDYNTAQWKIEYRRPSQNIITISGPFLGAATKIDEDEDNVNRTSLMPSGTRTTIHFKLSVLGRVNTPEALLAALKELLRTRFSEKVLRRVKMTFNIRGLNGVNLTLDSHDTNTELHSFRWHVDKGVRDGAIQQVCKDEEHVSNGAVWKLSRYTIKVKGNSSYELKSEFPTYGGKNVQTQRVHISLHDRTIEIARYHEFVGRKAPHNDDNGSIVFVDFVSDEMSKIPQPSTTKVTMYAEDPIYKTFVTDITGILTRPVVTDNEGSIAPVDGEANPEILHAPTIRRVDRAAKIETTFAVKFRDIDGVLHIKVGEHAWRPAAEFTIVPRA